MNPLTLQQPQASQQHQANPPNSENNNNSQESAEITCQKINCQQGAITKVCIFPGCKNNRLVCESDNCWREHIEHMNKVVLVQVALQKQSQIQDALRKVRQDYNDIIERKKKEFVVALEKQIKITDTPIFKVLDSKPIAVSRWKASDLNSYVSSLAQIDTSKTEAQDIQANARIDQLRNINVADGVQRMFNPTQNLSFASNQINLQYFRQVTQPILNDWNLQVTSHITLKFDKKSAYSSFKIANGNKTISLPMGMSKLAILPQNILLLNEPKIQLVIEYQGGNFLGDGKNKFGLFCGSLNQCTFEEKNHKNQLIVMGDDGNYSLQGNGGEFDEFKIDDEKCQICLTFQRTQNSNSLTFLNHKNVDFTIPIDSQADQVYFCIVLSAGGAEVEIK